MTRKKFKFSNISEPEEFENVVSEEAPKAKQAKRYVAVKGVSLDKFKAKYQVGDEIPLEYLKDPEVDFDNLLNKGAIKEFGSD